MALFQRRMLWIVTVAVVLGTALGARSALLRLGRDPDYDALMLAVDLESPELKTLLKQRDLLIPLHEPLGPPQPGDWLTAHPESGQTFPEFLGSQLDPPDRNRSRLYIVPIGDMTETQLRIVERTGEYLAASFGKPVVFLEAVEAGQIAPEGRRLWDETTGEEQWLTSYILQSILTPLRPDDAIAVLGLTATDLYPGPGWNYVFGQASLTARVGVWSLARNGNPDENDDAYRLCLRRTIKTALHETGHMLGIPHCTAFECGMNGSKNRDENDRHPLEFCPECQTKVWWSCGVDPARRCQQLGDLAAEDGLTQAMTLWHQEAARLKSDGIAKSR